MASIHRRESSPYWYAAFYMPDGSRVFRSTKTTDRRKAKAICAEWDKANRLARESRLTEAKAREIIADIFAVANSDQLPTATTTEFIHSWLTKKRLEIAERSLADYTKATSEMLSFLGARANKPMDSISAREIIAFRSKLAERVSASTTNKYLKILRGAWTEALKDGIVPENVFVRVGLVSEREGKKERRAFTLPELRRILAACDEEWLGVVLFGVYSGHRLSDIAGLTWRKIDLEHEMLHITTGKTSRVMSTPLHRVLVAHLMKMPSADDPDAPLFPNVRRTLSVNQSTLSRQFSDILAKAGLVAKENHEKKGKGRDCRRTTGGLSFHCLRHTATSLLKNAGVSDVVTREIIGHESEAVSRRYTHIEEKTLRKAISKIPNILERIRPELPTQT